MVHRGGIGDGSGYKWQLVANPSDGKIYHRFSGWGTGVFPSSYARLLDDSGAANQLVTGNGGTTPAMPNNSIPAYIGGAWTNLYVV